MQGVSETLRDNATIDDAAYQRQKAAAAAAGDESAARTVPVRKPDIGPVDSISAEGGLLKFSSPGGGNDQFQVGGRIQAEAAGYGADKQGLGNGTDLPPVRMFLAGRINGARGSEGEFDFSSGAISISWTSISRIRCSPGRSP